MFIDGIIEAVAVLQFIWLYESYLGIITKRISGVNRIIFFFRLFPVKKPLCLSDIKFSKEAENRAEGSVLLLAFFKFFEKNQKTFENPL